MTLARRVYDPRDAYQLDEELCVRFRGDFWTKQNLSCIRLGPRPIGAFVTVSIPPTAAKLQLCEVQIFGYKVKGKVHLRAYAYADALARTLTPFVLNDETEL